MNNELAFERQDSFDFLSNNDEFYLTDLKADYDLKIVEPDDSQEFEEFILYQENNLLPIPPTPSSALTGTKDISYTTDDNACCSEIDIKSYIPVDLKTHLKVSFDGENPDMTDFLSKIRSEISCKGVNNIICEALEITEDSDLLVDSPQLIRVKKRKSKEQIKALEAEFAKNNDWTKEFMNELAAELKLDPAQVYKWHWDQISKKLGSTPKRKVKEQKNGNKRKRSAPKSSRNKKAKIC